MEQPNDRKKPEEQIHSLTQMIVRMGILLAAVVVVGGLMMILGRRDKPGVSETEYIQPETGTIPSPQEELTERISYYPEHVAIGQALPDVRLYRADGRQITLEEYQGKTVVLSFFASWCGDCEAQFTALGDLDIFFSQYPDVVWLPADRLEEGRETQEMGSAYLQERGIQTECLFDRDRAAYDTLGGQMIPTTLFLDPEGRLQLCCAGVLSGKEQLAAMISYVENGRGADTEAFLTKYMMSEDGGVYTGYADVNGLAAGHDVLSESQGLLMEYAMEKGDAYLFLRALGFVQKKMMAHPLPVWVLEEEQPISVNALLDDLRMLKALDGMQKKYGGYEDALASLAEAIALYNVPDQKPVDFYDFQQKMAASRFTLCYADFTAFEILRQYAPIEEKAGENALALVEGGYISDTFPLYHNYYDYTTDSYDSGSINMAEGLYTLYHLAEAGKLKETSLEWIRQKMEQGAVYARYDTDGNVSVGYDYESPAVYALVGLIALEADDPILLTRALECLERFRVFDVSSLANGAIGGGTIEQMASYDQLMTLLLYAKIDGQRGD